MTNTGFITSSGIQQVFTSGPFLGSVVSSSYISGGIAFGPSINFNQNFISGSVDILSPCTTIFQRHYQDLVACPPNGCTPPTLTRAFIYCDPYDYKYSVPYNSGSSTATYTVMEYSTSKNFLSNTSSVTYNNSSPSLLPINVSDLLYLPTAYTPLYFRARNYCSNGATSSYSNVVFAPICDAPAPIPTTMTLNYISPPEYRVQEHIYTIEGEVGTRIDFSTSNLNNGNGYEGGIIYLTDLATNNTFNLSFITPTSGFWVIPQTGNIQFSITYYAIDPINTTFNCVGMDITFLDLANSNTPLQPADIIHLFTCTNNLSQIQ